MGLKIKAEKTIIEMRPNDGFIVSLELEDVYGEPLDVSSDDYMIRYVVKTLRQVPLEDKECLYAGIADKTEIKNVIDLSFDAVNTNFPSSKKPHYLIVQISNPKLKFSREVYYELYVLLSGLRTIY